MYVYKQGNNGYAMYLEIENEGSTFVQNLDDSHWKQSASIYNNELLSKDFREYLSGGKVVIYTMAIRATPTPAPAKDPLGNHCERTCMVDGCDETFYGYINICKKHTIFAASESPLIFESKYDKTVIGKCGTPVTVDVYRVLAGFGVINPQLQHLIKKALATGQRGHKDFRQDLVDIRDSAISAIEMFDQSDDK